MICSALYLVGAGLQGVALLSGVNVIAVGVSLCMIGIAMIYSGWGQ